MTKAFPFLNLIMTSTGWGAVSTILKVFGMTRILNRDLPIQIRVCYYLAKSSKLIRKDVSFYCESNFVFNNNSKSRRGWILITKMCNYFISKYDLLQLQRWNTNINKGSLMLCLNWSFLNYLNLTHLDITPYIYV